MRYEKHIGLFKGRFGNNIKIRYGSKNKKQDSICNDYVYYLRSHSTPRVRAGGLFSNHYERKYKTGKREARSSNHYSIIHSFYSIVIFLEYLTGDALF